jgi:hypothetical protein
MKAMHTNEMEEKTRPIVINVSHSEFVYVGSGQGIQHNRSVLVVRGENAKGERGRGRYHYFQE